MIPKYSYPLMKQHHPVHISPPKRTKKKKPIAVRLENMFIKLSLWKMVTVNGLMLLHE